MFNFLSKLFWPKPRSLPVKTTPPYVPKKEEFVLTTQQLLEAVYFHLQYKNNLAHSYNNATLIYVKSVTLDGGEYAIDSKTVTIRTKEAPLHFFVIEERPY